MSMHRIVPTNEGNQLDNLSDEYNGLSQEQLEEHFEQTSYFDAVILTGFNQSAAEEIFKQYAHQKIEGITFIDAPVEQEQTLEAAV